jgi:hypothetical protein
MKRAISSIIFGGATIFAFAQGSFTIVRPLDGSKIREMVKVLFPKNSVPEGSGYVGIFIDGDFLEAVAPKLSADKKYYEYSLDTKALTDGSHKLEAKLYVDYSNQPRIVDTSSVEITVANKSSIAIPEDGFQLRYHFSTGQERIYRLQQKVVQNIISEADQKKQGSRPYQIQEDGETLRMLYACDNAYGNGDGLVRMQIVPDKGIKGREYSYLTTANSGGVPKKFYPEDMAPIYMKISPTGREVFGAVPDYFGLEGNTGTGSRFALYASFPLPTLPSKGVKPGDTWGANFQLGAIDLQNLHTQKSVVEVVPARGELIAVEWEMGHPCAKIKNTIAEGSSAKRYQDGGKGAAGGVTGDQISDRKVSLEETIWFALDTGVVVKYFRDITIEGKTNFGFTSGGTGGAPTGGPSAAGAGNSGGGKNGGGGRAPGDFRTSSKQSGGAPQGSGGRGQRGPSGPGAAGTGTGGNPGQFAGPGGQQGGQAAFVRTRLQYLFVLEK